MEKRKSNEQKQDLDNALREIDAILEKYDVNNCLVVMATADAWCGAIVGRPRSLAYAIKDGMITEFKGQKDLILMVNFLNKIL